ncbi:WD40 repeat protein [Kribbella sp. VKM Ac-2527]|uniref:WD40 repeat protein n=1 Tax=Kribbella caucasensis TaxID=2512215 RepID=A0A4R6KEX9_9ACTN|nr:Hsp70 family protein [Kribbella sp. VKM Ac-2527]TDO47288.1 WD40 repeat protein [Kribbella sp. VKM Ac-2527]
MGYRLGVDLGTTFTAAAIRDGGPPTMLGLGNRALQIPSVLYLQEDGEFLVGEAAERRGAADPARMVREFKRRLGDPVPLLVAGTPFSAQALSAKLLASVVATATERRGAAPDEVVLTYPANWGAYKRELVDQVISLADVGRSLTCTEPQAAAIQYASQANLQPGDRVAVYDLGGGTFDVCVLEKTGAGFTILGTPEGIEQLGGVDFDEAVFQHVVTALGPAVEQLDLDSPEGRAALTRLRRDCVEAKEALSADVDTVIPVALPGRSTSVRLTRAELETLIAPALEQTVEATSRALRAANTTTEQLTAIVLVGGSSRIPLVSHLLQSRFSTPTALDTHPKHDIALGAVQFQPEEARTEQLGAVGTQLPSPTRTPLSAQAKRRLAIAAGGVVVLAGGVVAAMQLAAGDGGNPGGQTSVATNTPSQSVSSTTPTKPTTPTGPQALPEAPVKLADTELVIPLLRKVSADLTLVDLYVADVTNPAKRTKLTTKPNDDLPALAPNKRTMIYLHNVPPSKDRSLWVSGVDGSRARELFTKTPAQCAASIGRPGWNPKDPTQIVVGCTAADGTFGIYLLDTDGKVLQKLFSNPARKGFGASDPAVSPDGKLAVYEFHGGSGTGLYAVALDGKSEPQRLTSGSDADPVWSPTRPGVLAFRRVLGDNSATIFVTSVTGADLPCAGQSRPNEIGGGRMCQLTDASVFDQDPTWSPDGKRIAFKHGLNPSAIQVVPADASAAPQLVWPNNPGNQNAPAWTPR